MALAQAQAPALWKPADRQPPGAAAFLRWIASAAGPGEDELPPSLGERERAGEWQEWLRGQGLAAYSYHRLKGAALLPRLDASLQAALRQAYYAAVADAELHRAELAGLLDALSGAGVIAVPFKGAVLAYTAYPDPACRPMGDLDLWVMPEAMALAKAALEDAGYRQYKKADRPAELQAQFGGEIQLAAGGGRGLVELHYAVLAGEWVRQTTTIARDCIGCRCAPFSLACAPGCEAWRLAAEDAVLQLAVHLAVNHQMSYPGVRGLLDVVLQARSQPPDWMVLAQRARAWRVATATWLVLSLADEVLGLDEAQAAIATLRPGAARRRLLAKFSNAQTLLAGRDLTRGAARFAFQLLLVDRPRDAARLLVRTVWPERAWLRLRYGQAGWRVRLGHVAGVLRGRP